MDVDITICKALHVLCIDTTLCLVAVYNTWSRVATEINAALSSPCTQQLICCSKRLSPNTFWHFSNAKIIASIPVSSLYKHRDAIVFVAYLLLLLHTYKCRRKPKLCPDADSNSRPQVISAIEMSLLTNTIGACNLLSTVKYDQGFILILRLK